MTPAGFTIGQPFNPYKLFTGIFIPEALVRFADVSSTAKLAWGRLARYAGADGRCFPTVTTLAVEIGVKKRRMQDCLKELETAELIRREFNDGKASEYVFLWHPIFTTPDTAPVQDTAWVPVQDTAPPPVQYTAHKESQLKRVKKESHSSSGISAVASSDDDSAFSENGKPKTEDKEALIDYARDALRATVASAKVRLEGISQATALKSTKAPDKAITEDILNAFQSFDDFETWIVDTESRALANKARDPHAVYALYRTDAKTRAEGIAEDRVKEEKRLAAEEIAAEGERAAEAERQRITDTPAPPDAAIAAAELELEVPTVMQRRLIRLAQPITPATVIEMARRYHGCGTCSNRGMIGSALDKTRQFCDCLEGEELQHEDPERPAREIEHAHANTKNRLIAAAQMVSVYLSDAIEASEITETPTELIFDAPKSYRLYFKDKQFANVLKLADEQRAMRLVWRATA